jgi:alpha-glucosidase
MREHYRGLVATLAGAAKQQLVVTDEETEFHLAQNYRAWSLPAYREKYSEYEYSRSTLSAIKTAQTPLTLEGDGVAMAGHEAALVDFPSMNLRMPDSDRRMGKALSALRRRRAGEEGPERARPVRAARRQMAGRYT